MCHVGSWFSGFRFKPRIPRGCDKTIFAPPMNWSSFNPRIPLGMRFGRKNVFYLFRSISIHASLAGCDGTLYCISIRTSYRTHGSLYISIRTFYRVHDSRFNVTAIKSERFHGRLRLKVSAAADDFLFYLLVSMHRSPGNSRGLPFFSRIS